MAFSAAFSAAALVSTLLRQPGTYFGQVSSLLEYASFRHGIGPHPSRIYAYRILVEHVQTLPPRVLLRLHARQVQCCTLARTPTTLCSTCLTRVGVTSHRFSRIIRHYMYAYTQPSWPTQILRADIGCSVVIMMWRFVFFIHLQMLCENDVRLQYRGLLPWFVQ